MTESVVDVLRDQHLRVAELFERVAAPDEDRPVVLHRILRDLSAHVAAERHSVQPLVAGLGIGADIEHALMDDYDRIEKLMVRIERRKFNSPDVPGLVAELRDATDAHSARADRELFPALDSELSAERKRELAERLREEVETSPDRPSKATSRWDRLVHNRRTRPPGGEGGGPGRDASMGGST